MSFVQIIINLLNGIITLIEFLCSTIQNIIMLLYQNFIDVVGFYLQKISVLLRTSRFRYKLEEKARSVKRKFRKA